jgi:hypothetical protein
MYDDRDDGRRSPVHRMACESENHGQCRKGPLWTCRKCHQKMCAEDGAADAFPNLCDNCWYEATHPTPAEVQRMKIGP